MSQVARNPRKTVEGWVVSDKMDKTRVVEIRWSKQDPRYGKILHLSTRLKAHDEKNEAKSGDRVRLMATKKLSKSKNWRITDILEKQ